MSKKHRHAEKLSKSQKRKTAPAAVPSFPSETRSRSSLRTALRIAGWTVNLVLATLGAVKLVEDYVGPFWPTALILTPNNVTAENPFEIPFTIENPSILFGANDVRVFCHVVDLTDSASGRMHGNIQEHPKFNLPAKATTQKSCDFSVSVLGPRRAAIGFEVLRKNWWPFSRYEEAGTFVWRGDVHPAMWLKESDIKYRSVRDNPLVTKD